MVTLHVMHTTIRKYSTQHAVDGYGSGIGLHISYQVPAQHTTALINALNAVGFTTTQIDEHEIVLQCDYLEVFILPDAQYTGVIFSNQIAPMYLAINGYIGKLPG